MIFHRIMFRLAASLGLAVLTISLSGCGTYGSVPPSEARAQVQPGRTPESQALSALGKPGETEVSGDRRLHSWSQLTAGTGLVTLREYQVLVTGNPGLVRRTNYHEGFLKKEGGIVNTISNPTAKHPPSLDLLRPGKSGPETERIFGTPLSRTLKIGGETERTWIVEVSNLGSITNRKPRQFIALFDERDRLVSVREES